MSGGVRCPNCGQELKTQLYTPGARLIRCDNCGYTIPIKETETVREYKPEPTRPATLSRLTIIVITILLLVIAGLATNIVIQQGSPPYTVTNILTEYMYQPTTVTITGTQTETFLIRDITTVTITMDIGFTREEKEFLNLIQDLVYPYMGDGHICFAKIAAGEPPCDVVEYINRGKFILQILNATGSPSTRFDFLRQVAISEVEKNSLITDHPMEPTLYAHTYVRHLIIMIYGLGFLIWQNKSKSTRLQSDDPCVSDFSFLLFCNCICMKVCLSTSN